MDGQFKSAEKYYIYTCMCVCMNVEYLFIIHSWNSNKQINIDVMSSEF